MRKFETGRFYLVGSLLVVPRDENNFESVIYEVDLDPDEAAQAAVDRGESGVRIFTGTRRQPKKG